MMSASQSKNNKNVHAHTLKKQKTLSREKTTHRIKAICNPDAENSREHQAG